MDRGLLMREHRYPLRQRSLRCSTRVWAAASLVPSCWFLLSAATASAFPAKLSPSGQFDFDYGNTVGSAGGPGTGYKPESKLFYTDDGRWWAVFGTSGDGVNAAGVYLYELDANHTWQLRYQLPGSDAWAKADALLDGQTLYVVLRDNKSSSKTNPRSSSLYELFYDGLGVWETLTGPTQVTTSSPETLTVARDSEGRLWTAFMSGGLIKA